MLSLVAMANNQGSLEDMYAQLILEDEEEGGILVGSDEVRQATSTFILVGRFLTDKNINFPAMQNVLAALWRPRKGVEIHELGGQRYSFVFHHRLDMEKVLEGGPWTFEQSLLLVHKLESTEDPHLVPLHTMDIWVHVYDLPQGMIRESIMQSVGNSIGRYVKSDSKNMDGMWKQFIRIRVKMDINKPLKRRMKLKREGGEWSWLNFKYERLSMFCFVCGLLGHSDRDCEVVYANSEKTVERAYGVWLRAPNKSAKTQNIGAKWLRNGSDGAQTWQSGSMVETSDGQGSRTREANFTEEDGVVREKSGVTDMVRVTDRITRDRGDIGDFQMTENMEIVKGAGEFDGNEMVVVDSKRKRVDTAQQKGGNVNNMVTIMDSNVNGSKNGLEAGPGLQARLAQ